MLINSELANSQGEISGFDKNASKSSEFANLLKSKTLMEIGKPSLYVATGMENVLGVVDNDETIFGLRKIPIRLISATLLLSKKKKMLQTFLVGFSCT